jgi:hypothetical protein
MQAFSDDSWRPRIRERRTKDAHGAPAKGHEERTLADAPSRGAAQGTASSNQNLAVFRGAAS